MTHEDTLGIKISGLPTSESTLLRILVTKPLGLISTVIHLLTSVHLFTDHMNGKKGKLTTFTCKKTQCVKIYFKSLNHYYPPQ